MLDIIGWIGGILLGLCAIPQAYHSWKTRSAVDINWMFLLMWLSGEVLLFIYIWPQQDWPLLTNYLLNIFAIYVIMRSKVL